MASSHVYSTLRDFIATTVSPSVVVNFDDIDSTIEQGTDPFYVLQEVNEDEEQLGFGDPANLCMRETGRLRISCMVPSPESSGVARANADAIQAAIRYQRLAGVRVVDSDPPNPDLLNTGLWSSYGVTISYQYDTHVAAP